MEQENVSQIKHSAAKILVVDDEPIICSILSRWLEMEGYDCKVAYSGEEALNLIESEEFALMLSDIMMPGMSGIELLAKARGVASDLAVIMVTALDDRKTAIQTLELGAYGYIIKPFERNEILINVYNALERRRLVLESQAYEAQLESEVRERTEDIRKREEEIALRLISAAEYRDDETGAHIRRIGMYSEVLARALGWDTKDLDLIRVAAPMHDIGKIGIPDKILLKPGRLTPEEYEIIKNHTIIGANILGNSGIPLLQMGAEIALCHHEKWDGSGYPRRLSGKDIPESARLVAIADVYDALTNDRVYRSAMSEKRTLEIMGKGRGTHFDPEIFDCFLDVLSEFRNIKKEIPD